MKSAHLRFALPAAALLAVAASPSVAQRPPSPEQRIAMLEQQVAAGQASALRLEQRLSAIERQLQQLINIGEVNGHQVTQLRSDLSRLRSDLEARIGDLESRPAPQQVSEAPPEDAPLAQDPPEREVAQSRPVAQPAAAGEAGPSDPGEDSYSEGFRLWRDGRYDQAITSLRAFLSGFPNHRRASFARNLIGRALLDKGEPRPAAEALLANYRADPKGERAPDSLYYLGQSLMALKQPAQACKAYAELEEVYGAAIRPDLKTLVAEAKAEADCS
ncbi:MAG TPA: tetratricopeptide repeat protein [Sphingomicrobium sp.]|nr:tetratricopeptide repeat protein [Sphingomicrobium sp.]